MNRKDFIILCGYSCLSTTFPLMFAGCSSVHYVHTALNDNKVKVNKKEFEKMKKDKLTILPFIIVKIAGMKFPVALYRKSNSDYSALWMECTHQGCEVKPHEGFLTCPCHGSEYNDSGIVLEGPAEYDLRKFKVTTDNENIYIHIA